MRENNVVDLIEATERLEAVAEALESATERLAQERMAFAADAQEHVGRIVATVDGSREGELERKLVEAEARIVELMATAAVAVSPVATVVGRKTLPAGMVSMLAKQGVTLDLAGGAASIEASAIDGALSSLSIEQRIAVKAEMRRAGLLG